MTTHSSDTYQWRLRALGAFLDTQNAAYFTIIETRSGFAVRYYQGMDDPVPIFVQVEEAQLRAITEALRERRREPLASSPADAVLLGPITQDGKYQDFFRAIGWELDDLVAASIVLDEQEQGVFMAYAFRDPATGQDWRKRVATLGPIEKEQIMAEALKRRRLR
ncbi:MAG: hypothetical protein ACRDFX_00850 [Chloroflexota bacterium]